MLFVVLLGLVIVLILTDRGPIDGPATWRRVLTVMPIGLITIADGARRCGWFTASCSPSLSPSKRGRCCQPVIWLTNVIAFGLWYWDLDRGGAAARALGSTAGPAFLFPEMLNPGQVRKGWCPTFVDYLHLSVNTAMAFSPADVSAVKPWARLTMMAEEMISVAVGILVVARAVNILR